MTPLALRILDPQALRAYANLARLDRLNETEETVLRIARALSGDLDVSVEQAARHAAQTVGAVRFGPMNPGWSATGAILVVNSWSTALACRRHNARARILVWQHDLPDDHLRPLAPRLADAGIEIVCASNALAVMVRRLAGGAGLTISVIANPVADELHPDRTPRDPDLLFYTGASPNGLGRVLEAFDGLRSTFPRLRLEMAGPGCADRDAATLPPGVTVLGALPHPAVIAKMRKALCLFDPRTRFAETTGLMIAEANAVGCPVLVHRGPGANCEAASDASQRIDCAEPAQIERRIAKWRRSAPRVTADPRFRLSAVVRDWRQLLRTSPPAISRAPRSGLVHVV